jgi:outer membrane protein OmpA-like peptidoglycan-associated protein
VDFPNGADPAKEISRMETRLKDSEDRQVNMAAPNNFEKASDSLDKAKELRNNGKSNSDILHKVAESEAYLAKSEESAKGTTQLMSNVFEAREKALSAGAVKYYPTDLTNADEQLKEISASAENGSTSDAEKARVTLAARYNEIAIKTQQAANLAQPAPQPQASEQKPTVEQNYEMARKEFSPDEAEVYRQGSSILLRLKGLNFPSGQQNLSINEPLILKIQRVVKEVEPTSVVVEGHTDSTGSKTVNKKLSLERAKTLGNFLVSHNLIDPGQIKTIGYGESKPIASNKTEEGRAQNRRVDIILATE